MVRSQFIKTAITFAAGTGIGYAANAKYHGQGKVSLSQVSFGWLIIYDLQQSETKKGRYRRNNEILTEIYDPDSGRDHWTVQFEPIYWKNLMPFDFNYWMTFNFRYRNGSSIP